MTLPEPPRRTVPTPVSDADLQALGEAKSMLRAAVTSRRTSRTPDQRAADDHARFLSLQGFFADPEPGLCVAAYLSTGVEPDTLELVSWLYASGVRVLLPVLGPHTDGSPRREPDWAEYAGPDRLRAGFRGILEPTTDALGAEALAAAQVVICSALAGTETGERLGTGGGWYDRALEAAAPEAVTVMLLNDDEIAPALPTQPWDRVMDVIATPSRLISCRAGAPAPRPGT